MPKSDQESETYSEAETEARREAALKRMLATPHKPHAPLSKEKADDGKCNRDHGGDKR